MREKLITSYKGNKFLKNALLEKLKQVLSHQLLDLSFSLNRHSEGGLLKSVKFQDWLAEQGSDLQMNGLHIGD